MRVLSVLSVLILSIMGSASVSAKPLVLALNWKPEPQFGGFYAAQKAGYFRENKLDVEIIEGGSGTPTIQMLLAGRVDYAIVSGDEIVIAHARGGDIVALFATYQVNPQGIMTHASRGFESIEDVVHSDGVLLWQSGLPYTQFFRMKYAPLKVMTAPYLGGIGNFRNDAKLSQQCFVTSEPLEAKAVGLEVKTFLVAESGYNPYTTVLVTRRARLEQSPDEVKRMVGAVRAGWRDYLSDAAPTNRVMGDLNKAMSAETFSASAAAQNALIQTTSETELGSMTLERWQTLADQLLAIGVISKPVKVDTVFANL